jgi:hypothetical protein
VSKYISIPILHVPLNVSSVAPVDWLTQALARGVIIDKEQKIRTWEVKMVPGYFNSILGAASKSLRRVQLELDGVQPKACRF